MLVADTETVADAARVGDRDAARLAYPAPRVDCKLTDWAYIRNRLASLGHDLQAEDASPQGLSLVGGDCFERTGGIPSEVEEYAVDVGMESHRY